MSVDEMVYAAQRHQILWIEFTEREQMDRVNVVDVDSIPSAKDADRVLFE